LPQYLDTSALAKLILTEPESDALRQHIDAIGAIVTSALTRAELIRAVRRVRPEFEQNATALLHNMALIELSEDLLTAAGRVSPQDLRTLDAIHLTSALTLGAELDAVVTYDTRMIDAARAAGLRVESPA
jgi:predicted nucleic acid-binding protein